MNFCGTHHSIHLVLQSLVWGSFLYGKSERLEKRWRPSGSDSSNSKHSPQVGTTALNQTSVLFNVISDSGRQTAFGGTEFLL